MGLSPSERQTLAAIADRLARDDPAFVALFVGFGVPPQVRRRSLWNGLAIVTLFALAPTLAAIGLSTGLPALLFCGCALTLVMPCVVVLWSNRLSEGGGPAFAP